MSNQQSVFNVTSDNLLYDPAYANFGTNRSEILWELVQAPVPVPSGGGGGGGGGGGRPWGRVIPIEAPDGVIEVFPAPPRRPRTGDPLLDAPREALENEVLSLRRKVAVLEGAARRAKAPDISAFILKAIQSGMGSAPVAPASAPLPAPSSMDPLLAALLVALGTYILVPDKMTTAKTAGYISAAVIALKKFA